MPAVTAAAVLEHLGEDSALARSSGRWTFAQHIAVRSLEEIDHLSRITLRAHGVKARDLPKPLHIPRPGEKAKAEAAAPKPALGWLATLVGTGSGVEVSTVG
jgi:hypothetical protein